MTADYIVASLPTLRFDAPAPIAWEKFAADAADFARLWAPGSALDDLETQLRNAAAEARGGERWKRPAAGCSLHWKARVLAAFQEKDVAKRDELIDRAWWDAADDLTDVASPLGEGAIATYAMRLRIAIRRGKISTPAGNAAFDALTAATKRTF